MSNLVKVATCNINQFAMDFEGNLERIIQSIVLAKAEGAKYRIGPELEISGYGCEDHFGEHDTWYHSMQSLATILKGDLTNDILCDIGLPLMHKNVLYNCRVFCLNGKILMIRPKMYMANDGNYREQRWFTPWSGVKIENHRLDPMLQEATGQVSVPFGEALLQLADTMIGVETCEELWTPSSMHIRQYLAGAEILGNSSGSHHQLRKLDHRLDLMRSATTKAGGCYLYSNLSGCDGGRLYFDGSAAIFCNGRLIGQGSQFSFHDVEMVYGVVDLQDIRNYRASIASFQMQASFSDPYPIVDASFFSATSSSLVAPSPPLNPILASPAEEIAYGPACWLWDYMRRSGAGGFFVPLSGGADSASVAVIVFVMCTLVVRAAQEGNKAVLQDLQRLMEEKNALPLHLTEEGKALKSLHEGDSIKNHIPSPKELCNLVLHTCYMGSRYSSMVTRRRAHMLAQELGAFHKECKIDKTLDSYLGILEQTLDIPDGEEISSHMPRFQTEGGSMVEDLALQNIQARTRMVSAYMMSQLLPWQRGWKKGFVLNLATGNVDESLRGYMTKYDCSSGDLNPVGGISKLDLYRMLVWAADEYNLSVVMEIIDAPPSAELRPQGLMPTLPEEEEVQGDKRISKSMSSQDLPAHLQAIGLQSLQENSDRESFDDNLEKRSISSMTSGEGGLGEGSLSSMVESLNNSELNILFHEHTQKDEEEMGMSYYELGVFGVLRKVWKCGPVSMFKKLCNEWMDRDVTRIDPDSPLLWIKEGETLYENDNEDFNANVSPFSYIYNDPERGPPPSHHNLSAREIAEKVKRFFYYYSINRHKLTVLTPSYHAENYSTDDNRFDLRQFLYPSFDRQFHEIDLLVARMESEERKEGK